MSVVGDSRVAILGRVSANLAIVTLVDLRANRVIDHFFGWWPVISADRRFVAFVKWFPPHIGYEYSLSDEYLVYDLTASAIANRTPLNRTRPLNPYDVGWPVYPAGSKNTSGDNVLDGHDIPTHSMSSNGFFWLGRTDRVAFVDRWRGVNSLVVVAMDGGVRQPRLTTRALATSRIVDLGKCSRNVAVSDFDNWSKEPAILIYVMGITLVSTEERVCDIEVRVRPPAGPPSNPRSGH